MATIEVVRTTEELHARGATAEEIVRYLRDSGLSILESIQMLTKVQNISLSEAKKAVHYSETWADLRSEHDRFHQKIEEVVRAVADESESN